MGKIEIADEDFTQEKEIRPYKLAAMMRMSTQIIDKICNMPQFVFDYDDIEFILDIIMNAVKRARKRGEDGR